MNNCELTQLLRDTCDNFDLECLLPVRNVSGLTAELTHKYLHFINKIILWAFPK